MGVPRMMHLDKHCLTFLNLDFLKASLYLLPVLDTTPPGLGGHTRPDLAVRSENLTPPPRNRWTLSFSSDLMRIFRSIW